MSFYIFGNCKSKAKIYHFGMNDGDPNRWICYGFFPLHFNTKEEAEEEANKLRKLNAYQGSVLTVFCWEKMCHLEKCIAKKHKLFLSQLND